MTSNPINKSKRSYKVPDSQNITNTTVPHPIIQAQQLGKIVSTSEGLLTILEDINFSVNPGETIAIVGASGSGKSTLLGLLAGLDLPSQGRALLLGVDLNTLDEDGRASLRAASVGFVFQSFQLLPSLTALENVMLPLELTGQDRPRESAVQVLGRVGMSARLHHYPNQLSGGEQQRTALARAFAAKPRLLFADEPTGNLDQKTGAKVIDLLYDLNTENDTTLILVTHDQALSSRCQRQIELEAGRLILDRNTGVNS